MESNQFAYDNCVVSSRVHMENLHFLGAWGRGDALGDERSKLTILEWLGMKMYNRPARALLGEVKATCESKNKSPSSRDRTSDIKMIGGVINQLQSCALPTELSKVLFYRFIQSIKLPIERVLERH